MKGLRSIGAGPLETMANDLFSKKVINIGELYVARERSQKGSKKLKLENENGKVNLQGHFLCAECAELTSNLWLKLKDLSHSIGPKNLHIHDYATGIPN